VLLAAGHEPGDHVLPRALLVLPDVDETVQVGEPRHEGLLGRERQPRELPQPLPSLLPDRRELADEELPRCRGRRPLEVLADDDLLAEEAAHARDRHDPLAVGVDELPARRIEAAEADPARQGAGADGQEQGRQQEEYRATQLQELPPRWGATRGA